MPSEAEGDLMQYPTTALKATLRNCPMLASEPETRLGKAAPGSGGI